MFVKKNKKTSKFKLVAAFSGLFMLTISASSAPVLAQSEDFSTLGVSNQNSSKSTPVMTIRFNQKNVYFLNPLRQVIGKIDSKKPSANYELNSVIPAGQNINPANGKEFDENVRSVITVMGRLGVSADKITVTTEQSSSIENQEVNIIIK